MTHPLEAVIRGSEGFLLIGDSAADRFPGLSFHSYTAVGKKFYCLDMGGLSESRGKSPGREVYTSVEALPDDRDDLAIIWVPPRSAERAVELAHSAGCTRVWFSFQTGHRDAVARAEALGMTVVEIGRCPVYYMDEKVGACKAHTALTKLTGTYGRPPQTRADAKRREVW